LEKRLKPESGGEYGEAITPRIDALDRALGPHTEYLVSPIPFWLDGSATIAAFPEAIPGAVLYCTSEMTGWDSDQQVGEGTQFEFAIALPAASTHSPKSNSANSLVGHGWVGSFLTGMSKFSSQALLLPAETVGPLSPDVAPMTRLLLTEFSNFKAPFEYGGKKYGIRLMTLITESEYEFAVAKDSVQALIDTMRRTNPYLISDLKRMPVA